MKKAIIVINGKGGIGKDTLINAFAEDSSRYVNNVSSIDPIKKMCEDLKPDTKSLAYRHLLADMKYSVDAYYMQEHDISYTNDYLLRAMRSWKYNCRLYEKNHDCFLFVHIREPENIDAFIKAANEELSNTRDKDIFLMTMLVTSNRSLQNYGNIADDGVEDYQYDTVFESNGTPEYDAQRFIKHIYHELQIEAPVKHEIKNKQSYEYV